MSKHDGKKGGAEEDQVNAPICLKTSLQKKR